MAGHLIFTVGRAIVDLYAEESHRPLSEVTTFHKYVGGSSANTAVGLARLGARPAIVARVGRDPLGTFIRRKLTDEGVDTAMLVDDDKLDTGIAMAALFPPSDSEVWFVGKPNANSRLTQNDLRGDLIREGAAIVIAGTALASESSRLAVATLLEAAAQFNIPRILDVDWRR